MKTQKEDLPKALSTIRSTLIAYYREITNKLPHQSSPNNLSTMSIQEIISSLQSIIGIVIDDSLLNQQSTYETILQNYERQIRSQYGQLCQWKLQREAMEKKIHSLCSQVEEYDNVRRGSGVLTQKENEILILRAENSNLKSTLFKLEEKIDEYNNKIESLEKQLAEYTSNQNNININIKDISNSKVIIKTNSQYSLSANKKKQKQINLSESNSNRNVFLGTYRSAFSSNRTTQGSQCQTKGNSNTKGNKIFINGTINNNNSNNINCGNVKNMLREHSSFVNNTSRLWNSIQKDMGKRQKTNAITKFLVSSLQNSHSHSNSSTTIKKSTKNDYKSPETFRKNYPKVTKSKMIM